MTADTTIQEQAKHLLSHAAGYVAHRTIALGLRSGLIAALADRADGATTEELAAATGTDPFYTAVWCQSATASGLLDREGERHVLAPHAATLLLDEASPAYVGGVFTVLEQPEVFDEFERRLPTGERMWWDDTSATWLEQVARTGRPFFARMVAALDRIPDLEERLAHDDAAVLDTACGTGTGLVMLAERFPSCRIVGADGDDASLRMAEERLREAGFDGRVELVHTPLEKLSAEAEFDLITNNVSMHESRDLDAVTSNVHRALRPGGWFVISDFPFPDDVEALRSVPGRVMSGIQFFEALIDDQLLPPSTYRELLTRHGFGSVDTIGLTPVHALTIGRR